MEYFGFRGHFLFTPLTLFLHLSVTAYSPLIQQNLVKVPYLLLKGWISHIDTYFMLVSREFSPGQRSLGFLAFSLPTFDWSPVRENALLLLAVSQ